MKKFKSFLVQGNTTTYNGKMKKDIAENVDKEVNQFLSTLDGVLIDVKATPILQGASGDYAFVTVLYEKEETVEEKPEVAVEEVEDKKKPKKRWA